MRELAKTDLYWLCTEVLGYDKFYEPLHGPICAHLTAPGTRKGLLIPREHYKSTVGTVGYSVQRILKNCNIRILISNATEDNAHDFAGEVQSHFRENEKLLALFPEYAIKSKRFTKSHFTVPCRTKTSKEDTVESVGVGTNIVSRHYDLIIHDDLVNLECYRSPAKNETVKQWYAASEALIMHDSSAGDECTELIIGTRWHQNDLYADLLKNKEYTFFVRGLKNDDGTYILPTSFDEAQEKAVRNKMLQMPGGDFLFHSQYYNNPINLANQRFTPDMFRESKKADLLDILPECKQYLLVDPSASKEYYSDPAAFLLLWVSPDRHWFVEPIHNNKMEPDEAVSYTHLTLPTIYSV